MAIEKEVSYVISDEIANRIKTDPLLQVRDTSTIVDYYITPTVRIRHTSRPKRVHDTGMYMMTEKKGDKSSGQREENEFRIEKNVFDVLCKQSKLQVKKERTTYSHSNSHLNDVHIVLDEVESPLKVNILEIEGTSDASKIETITQGGLNPCPLSAWNFFKRRIALCGGPSCGKSETAKRLSNILNCKYGANSFNVTEYATSFIQKYNRNPELEDQFFIWHGQHSRENDANRADIVISDCPTFLSYIYALENNKNPLNDKSMFYLSKLYKRVIYDLKAYTDVFLMQPRKYVDNGIRFQDQKTQLKIHEKIKMFLDDHKIPYNTLNSDHVEYVPNTILCINQ